MKPGSREVVVNLASTNVPGLAASAGGGGGLGFLPLLAGVGIVVVAMAVIAIGCLRGHTALTRHFLRFPRHPAEVRNCGFSNKIMGKFFPEV